MDSYRERNSISNHMSTFSQTERLANRFKSTTNKRQALLSERQTEDRELNERQMQEA